VRNRGSGIEIDDMNDYEGRPSFAETSQTSRHPLQHSYTQEHGVDQDESPNREASISRRKALKLGVATGVGAAAWGGPHIGVLGQAPAYAQACSIPAVIQESTTKRGVDCSAGCSPWFGLQTESVSLTFQGVTFSVTVGGCANSMADWTDGSPANTDCQVEAIPIVKVQGVETELPAVIIGTATSTFTSTNYQCNSEYRIKVTCAQSGCL